MHTLSEVENAIKNLGLNNEVRLVSGNPQDTYNEIYTAFVSKNDVYWWWEHFIDESESISFNDSMGFKAIGDLVPDTSEILWFIVEDSQLPHFPIFEASTNNIIKIIGECFAFEYYLVPKTKSWLLCENHHDYVIGVGEAIVQSIKGYKALYS